MKNKNLLMLVLGVIFLSGAGNAHAQFGGKGNDDGRKEKMEKRFKEVIEQLNLSEEQKKLLEENKKKNAVITDDLRAKSKQVMKLIGEELKKKDLDMTTIASLRVQFKGFRNQMEDVRFNGILEVRKILTQEQFAQFVGLIEKHKEKKTDD